MARINPTSMHNTVIANLVNSDREVTVMQYVQGTGKKLGLEIDRKFTEEIVKLVQEDTLFCVPQEKLAEYDVIAIDDKHAVSHICKFLNTCHLEENTDYEIRKVKTESGQTRNHYWLTADAFSVCLQRSQRTKKYSMWYAHVVRAVVYFDKYVSALRSAREAKKKEQEIACLEKIMQGKDDKIGKLERAIEDMKATVITAVAENTSKLVETKLELVSTRTELTSVKGELVNVKGELHTASTEREQLKGKVEEGNERLSVLHDNVSTLQDSLGVAVMDRVPKPRPDQLQDLWVIFLHPKDRRTHDFALRYGRERYLKEEVVPSLKRTYPEVEPLLAIKSHPNPANLIVRFVEKMKDHIRADNRSKLYSPRGISRKEFLQALIRVNNEKYLVNGKLVEAPRTELVKLQVKKPEKK